MYTAGPETITATDGAGLLTPGSLTVTVTAAAASTFGFYFPSPITAGVFGYGLVSALDPYGNIVTGYTDPVKITSTTDLSAVCPLGAFVLTNGYGDFSVAFQTPGTAQTITATDPLNPSIHGTSSDITVQSNSPNYLVVSGFPITAFVGVPEPVTVTAYNLAGNVAAGYDGTVTMTTPFGSAIFSSPSATVFNSPNSVDITNGVGSCLVTFTSSGPQLITATDLAGFTIVPQTGIDVITGSPTFTVGTQYPVTFTTTGLGGDSAGPLVYYSVNGGSYTSINVPGGNPEGTILVDAGDTVSYIFYNPVASSNSGEQYLLTSVMGNATTITAAGTITVNGGNVVTGNYVVQYVSTLPSTGGTSTSVDQTQDNVETTISAPTAPPGQTLAGETLTVSSALYNTGVAPYDPNPVAGGIYFDIMVTATPADPNAMVTISIANPLLSGQSTVRYWNEASLEWVSIAATPGPAPYTLSFTLSVADLTGTPILIQLTPTVVVSNTFTATGLSGADSVTLMSTDLGEPSPIMLDSGNGWSAAAWTDYGTSVTFPAISANSGATEQWSIGSAISTPILTASGGSYSEDYIDQVSNTFTASGIPPSAQPPGEMVGGSIYGSYVTLTTTYLGTSTPVVLYTGNSFSDTIWTDYDTPVIFSATASPSRPTQQWAAVGSTSTAPFTTGGNTYTEAYVLQFLVTFTNTGLGADATGNLVTYNINGGAYFPISVPIGSVWVDYGAYVSYTFANPVTSSNTGERYMLNSVTDPESVYNTAISGSSTVTGNYVTQYQVTFTVSPSGSGVTSIAGTNWENAGPLMITATPNSGYTFSSWSSNTGLITFSPNSASTTANIGGTGTITATFTTSTTPYTITVTQGANGVITPATTIVNSGGSKTFTITPNTGYNIASIIVDGSQIQVTSPSNQQVSFTNVQAPHSITATFGLLVSGNNKVVTLTGSNNILIMTGTGDTINAAGATATKIIQTGTGSDTINLGGGNNVVVDTSTGSDIITINGNGNNQVTVGNGANTITINGNGINTVNAGNGGNKITINGNGGNQVTVGNGANTITINGNGINTINAGGGINIITITGNGGNKITVGTGTNSITITGNGNNQMTVGSGTIIVTGNGYNTVNGNKITNGKKIIIT